jgi:type II secretory ATPase GspE/PulE/Tfp pilus assembly ATPase PilB-like protein
MVSIPGDRVRTNSSSPADSSLPPKSHDDPVREIDTEQSFRLIDSILPFEACLYHQILPVSLEGSRLNLGMVNPDDSTALDYVRRILAYMNCSLVPHPISSDIHHSLLSAYLNYAGKQKQIARSAEKVQTPNSELAIGDGVVAETPQPEPTQKPNILLDRNTQPTLVVDSPEELSFVAFGTGEPSPEPVVAPQIPLSSEEVTPAEPATFFQAEVAVDAVPPPEPELTSSTLILSAEPPSGMVTSVDESLPVLEIDAKHLSDSVEVLATLPPKQLLQELLGRILVGGIGRLYFERQQKHGRILWSQNGVLQSVVEHLNLDLVQGVINELKLLTHMPLIPVQQAKQVEIERLYQQHRLLLRLRIMPGTHGEEATLQVLRGAALKFYQQQQLANLSRDALTIAQQLQNKVNEIRTRARLDTTLAAEQLEMIPTLHQLLKSVDQQLEALRDLQATEKVEKKN